MSEKLIALTFDDGPNLTTTNDILDKLEKYGVTATFFVVGDNIGAGAAAMKRAFDMGCEIQNHSKTHSDMTKLSGEEIRAEIEFTDRKIFEITGAHSSFFRPPYIAVNETMFDSVGLPFIAGIGANDWEPEVTADERADRILAKARDGAVILLHDSEGNDPTVEALDRIIPGLTEQGYEFVTVSALFAGKGKIPEKGIVYTFTDQTVMLADG